MKISIKVEIQRFIMHGSMDTNSMGLTIIQEYIINKYIEDILDVNVILSINVLAQMLQNKLLVQ